MRTVAGLLLAVALATGCGGGLESSDTPTTTTLPPTTTTTAAPAAGPSGDLIAFTSDRDGDDEIFVMNADGTDLYPTGQKGESPSWGA